MIEVTDMAQAEAAVVESYICSSASKTLAFWCAVSGPGWPFAAALL